MSASIETKNEAVKCCQIEENAMENWSVIRDGSGQVERIRCGGCNTEVFYRGDSHDLSGVQREMEGNDWRVALRVITGSGLIMEENVLICPLCQDRAGRL